MIFNNQLNNQNIISTFYVSANLLFNQDLLYSPLLNHVKLIDLSRNHTSILPFQTHNQIRIIKCSPDGVLLIAIDLAGYAVVFNLKGNFIVAEFNFKGNVNCAEFSNDGRLFAIAQNNGFCVYEAPSHWRTFEPFVLIKKYKNRHSSEIRSIKFAADNRFIITCGNDNIIYFNNIFPIEGYLPISLEVHRYSIIGVEFTNDMKYVYSVDSGSNIYVWKWTSELTQKYQNYKSRKMRLLNHNRQKRSHFKEGEVEEEEGNQPESHPLYSEFEVAVVSGRYVLAQKLTVTQPASYLKRVHYNSSNGFFVAAYSNGTFAIYKLIEQSVTLIQSFSIGNHKISTMAVNPSCTWIGLGIKELGQLIVWEWKSQSYIISQKGFIHNTQTIASNEGKFIATGTSEGQVKLWEQKSGFCVATFKEHESTVTDIKFANDTTLFSSSLDGTVNAYDAVKYRQFKKYKTDRHCQLNCLAVDESGDIIFAGAFDPYEVFAWNVKTANILQIVRGHEGPISCIEICGQHLVTGSWDRTLKIHEIYSRKLNVETLDHSSQVTALALHPNKKQIAVATMKGEIYIWELGEAQLAGIINAEIQGGRSYFSKISASNNTNTKYLKTIVYSACGKYLLGGGKSKYLMVYDVKNRMVFKKIQLTKSRDLQGTMEKLNSKYVKEGTSTYEMMLEEQEKDLSDDDENGLKLPGSKKVDVSEIRKKLQVDVRKIILLSHNSFAVSTSFGVLIYSSSSQNRLVFNPYQLMPNVTPQTVIELLTTKSYAACLIAALQLNLPIKKIIAKIPLQYLHQTVEEIDNSRINMLLEKLSEGEVDERQGLWVRAILKREGVIIPRKLRLSLENMNQQVQLLSKARAMLEASQLMTL